MPTPRRLQVYQRQGSIPRFDQRWYAVYPAHWLSRRPKRLKLHGHWLALFRDQEGRAHALGDRCPHLGASLAGGRRVMHSGTTHLECPYHGFLYDSAGVCVEIPRGGAKAIPKTLCTPRYVLREVDGWLFLYWGESPHPDSEGDLPPIDYFPDMIEHGPRARHWVSERVWPIHLSRVIENMLDVAHLGTVHRGWLSYTLGDRVDPHYDIEGARFDLYQGSKDTYVSYGHPNLWMQWLGPKFLTTAALVPEDEQTTRIYLRSSQGFVRLPGLGELLAGAKHLLDSFALWQDSQVVFTQTPITAEGHRLDGLVEFDAAIGALRKFRKGLQDESEAPDAAGDLALAPAKADAPSAETPSADAPSAIGG